MKKQRCNPQHFFFFGDIQLIIYSKNLLDLIEKVTNWGYLPI